MTTLITDARDPHTGGRIAVDLPTGIVYPLTLCCEASAKGMEGGIGCRGCYEYVEDGFGMGWHLDDMPTAIKAEVLAAVAAVTTTP